jgi:hypothetical protein
MGFIHMNGRVYDPQIGRFLSADPHIQDPYNTQSYNRYSYVMNNPLKYTDPSGYWWNPFKAAAKAVAKAWRSTWRSVKKYGRVIIAAVIAYYTGGLVASSAWANCTVVGSSWVGTAVAGAAGGAAFGASSTLLYGGSVSDAINAAATGAVSGAITGGIAGQYGNTWNAQRIGASAFGGGISAELQGGKFKDGFKAGFISSSLRHLYNKTMGYDATLEQGRGLASEGGNYPENTNNISIPQYNKVFGINQRLSFDGNGNPYFWSNFFKQGGALGNVANYIPGMHSLSRLHDYYQVWFDKISNANDGWLRGLGNVPAMVPATVVNYGALTDQYGISVQLRVKQY